MGVSLQVIYKKFNIPCSLLQELNNTTPADSNISDHGTNFTCKAEMVTINSEVKEKNVLLVLFIIMLYVMVRTTVAPIHHLHWSV